MTDDIPIVNTLLINIKATMPALEEIQRECDDEWGGEDAIYRFYHQSYKVYYAQDMTEKIVKAIKALLPETPLNEWFTKIVSEGTGKSFAMDDNKRWLEVTRPILEAYFHAKHALDMAIKYGKYLKSAPSMLPCGWANILYLYNLR